jgi:hypothetical protein
VPEANRRDKLLGFRWDAVVFAGPLALVRFFDMFMLSLVQASSSDTGRTFSVIELSLSRSTKLIRTRRHTFPPFTDFEFDPASAAHTYYCPSRNQHTDTLCYMQ